jgi:hypothetical protein
MMNAKCPAWIGGLINGTILGALVLGVSWLLKVLFSIPPYYSLAALVALPWMILVAGWCVFWPLMMINILFRQGESSGEEVEVTLALIRWMLGGKADAKYTMALGFFALLALGGSLLGTARWAFHIESALTMSLIGCTIGFFLALGRAGVTNFKLELVRLVIGWVAVANTTFLDEISIPGGETLVVISEAFFDQGTPRLAIILAVTAGLGGLLGLLMPPD